MNIPKSVTINDIAPGTIQIQVRVGWKLRARIRIAVALFKTAAWLLGQGVEIKDADKDAES